MAYGLAPDFIALATGLTNALSPRHRRRRRPRAHRLAERLCRGALAALEANGEGGRAKQRVAGFSVNNDPSDCRSDARLSAVSAATISLSLK